MTNPDMDMDPDMVDIAADGLRRAGEDTTSAWRLARGPIGDAAAAVGPPGRLSTAFYSGYTRREKPLIDSGDTLPGRFEERADAGRQSAQAYRDADYEAARGFAN